MVRILAPLFQKHNSASRCINISGSYSLPMDKSKRSKIAPIHIEEAARLKAIYAERITGVAKMSQEAFGQQYEIGSQGMVWQYLNGKSALNLDAALKFANALGCDVSDFSPRLAAALPPARASAITSEREPDHTPASDVSPSPDAPGPAATAQSAVSPLAARWPFSLVDVRTYDALPEAGQAWVQARLKSAIEEAIQHFGTATGKRSA